MDGTHRCAPSPYVQYSFAKAGGSVTRTTHWLHPPVGPYSSETGNPCRVLPAHDSCN